MLAMGQDAVSWSGMPCPPEGQRAACAQELPGPLSTLLHQRGVYSPQPIPRLQHLAG